MPSREAGLRIDRVGTHIDLAARREPRPEVTKRIEDGMFRLRGT